MRVIPFPRVHRDHWLAAVHETSLSTNAKWLAAVCIEELEDDGQHVQVSVQHINRRWRLADREVSMSQIQTAIKNLRAAGWLELIEPGIRDGRKPQANRYRLTHPRTEAQSA